LNNYYDGDGNYGTIISETAEIPSAEGYPFTRNIYMNDATDRVKETGLPGETLRAKPEIANPTTPPNTVRVSYTKATDEELLPIFGAEVPDANTVLKQITIDQNQVKSIAYYDMSGKIIATCLQDNAIANPNLSNLNNDEEYLQKTFNYQITGMNKIGNSYFAYKSIGIDESILEVKIHYEMPQETVTLSSNDDGFCGLPLEDKTLDFKVNLFILNLDRTPWNLANIYNSDVDGTTKDILHYPTLPGNNNFSRVLTYNADIDIQSFKSHVYDFYTGQINNIFKPIYKKLDDLRALESTGQFTQGSLQKFYAYLTDGTSNGYKMDDNTKKEWVESQERQNFELELGDPSCLNKFTIPKIICDQCEKTDCILTSYDKFEQYLFNNLTDEQKILLGITNVNDTKKSFYRNGDKLYKLVPSDPNFSSNPFNVLIQKMSTETIGIYPVEDYKMTNLCNCWTNEVAAFGVKAFKLTTLADIGKIIDGKTISTEGQLYINKNFDLLEEFLKCTGKMYQGISNHEYGTAGNNQYGMGYIDNAYKFFKYTIDDQRKYYTGNIDGNTIEGQSLLQIDFSNQFIPVPTFFDLASPNNTINYDFDSPGPGISESNKDNKRWELFASALHSANIKTTESTQKLKDIAKNDDNYSSDEQTKINSILKKIDDAETKHTLPDNDLIRDLFGLMTISCEKGCESRKNEITIKVLEYFHSIGSVIEGDTEWKDQTTDVNSPRYKKFYPIEGNPRSLVSNSCNYEIDVRINSGTIETKTFYYFKTIDAVVFALIQDCMSKCDVELALNDKNILIPNSTDLDWLKKMMRKPNLKIEHPNVSTDFCPDGYSKLTQTTLQLPNNYKCYTLITKGNEIVKTLNDKLNELISSNANVSFTEMNKLNKRYEICNELQTALTTKINSYLGEIVEISGRDCDDNNVDDHTIYGLDYTNYDGSNQYPPLSGYFWGSNLWDIYSIHVGENWHTDNSSAPHDPLITDYTGDMFPAFILRNNNNRTPESDRYYQYFEIGEINSIESTPPTCELPIIFKTVTGRDAKIPYRYMELQFAKIRSNFETCPPPEVCIKWEDQTAPDFTDVITRPKTCLDEAIPIILNSIASQIKSNVDDKVTKAGQIIEERINEKLKDFAEHEEYTVTAESPKYYHYTLYYYDRAGNLLRTVPPKGISIDLNRTRADIPPHTFVTNYDYNSLGQLVASSNPDHDDGTSIHKGYTVNIYNLKGQLRFSQDSRQRSSNLNDHKFSYVKYDKLGRVEESGEMTVNSSLNDDVIQELRKKSEIDAFPDPNASAQPEAIPSNMAITFKTNTYYDSRITAIPSPYSSNVQNNLRNRVSYTVRDPNPSSANDEATTIYSYDLHGNVEWIISDFPSYRPPGAVSFGGNFTTKDEYEYDLISGKVNKIIYDRYRDDEMYHKYSYDASNRITKVETSRHEEVWDADSKYYYYLHGPLQRIEVGQDNLQGLDYSYTINGWLKTINNSNNIINNDPGRDGNASNVESFAQDGFGMSLHYFDGDFLSSSDPYNIRGTAHPMGAVNLYNGNIAGIITNFNNTQNKMSFPNYYNIYNYDLLNRITQNKFNGVPEPGGIFSESFSYDPNGNFKTLNRVKSIVPLVTDNFSYTYYDGTLPATNKLKNINGTTSQQYIYDEIGNLKSDVSDPAYNVSPITWTPDGKIEEITEMIDVYPLPVPPVPQVPMMKQRKINFYYDARGQRIAKTVFSDQIQLWCNQSAQIGGGLAYFENCYECMKALGLKNTYYMREANEQVLAVYEVFDRCETFGPNLPSLVHWNIYGSESHGLFATRKPDDGVNGLLLSNDFNYDDNNILSLYPKIDKRFLGGREYEFKDHLGNVRETFSDIKVPVSVQPGAGPYSLDLKSINNYYAFGMLMPVAKLPPPPPGTLGQSWQSEKHRYGFNGMEMDNDILGKGIEYTTEFREYNSKIGRWITLDPVIKPYESPYVGFGNNPILYCDPEGTDEIISKQATGSSEGEQRQVTKQGIDFNTLLPYTYTSTSKEFWHIGENGTGSWLSDNEYSGKLKTLAEHAFDENLDASKFGFKTNVPYDPNFSQMFSEAIKNHWEKVSPILPNGEMNPWFIEGIESNDFDVLAAITIAGGISKGLINLGIKKILQKEAFSELEGLIKLGACFVSGTLILSQNGLIEIQNVKAGDSVWSYNIINEKVELAEVTNNFVRSSNDFIKLYFDNDSVICTLEHPFFVNNAWIAANKLKIGDQLISYVGLKVQLDSIYTYRTDIATTIYNFEVPKNHSYFVSNIQILVHNQSRMGYTTVIKKLADNSALKSELPIPAGYSQVRGVFSEGQKVFYNGKNYISPDVTSHIGGFWKMAKKVKLLKNPETRMGTYDKLLNKIGD
jgi:RHS repeat-associated protein